MPKEYPNLAQRTRTAILLVLSFVVLLVFARATCGGRIALTATALLIAAGAAWELSSVACRSLRRAQQLGLFAALLAPSILSYWLLGASDVCASIFNPARGTRAIMLGWGSAVLASVSYMVWRGQAGIDRASEAARDLMPCMAMAGFACIGLIGITTLPRAPMILVWLVLVVASNDIAAYFGGVRIGGPKLSPHISPNKTVSGAACGLLVGAVIGILLCRLLSSELSFFEAIFLSLAVVITAQLGDLTKSFLKRQHGVKDMGRLLPGHGGLVDRLDGVLLASPLLYAWLSYRELLL